MVYLRFGIYHLLSPFAICDAQMTVPFIEENDQTIARREHLESLRALVGNVYPNKFVRSNVTDTPAGEDTITSIVAVFKNFEPKLDEGEKPSPEILNTANGELNKTRVRVAGRIAAPPRVMGKAAFLHLSDGVSRLQIYLRRQDVVGLRNDAESTTNLSLSNTVDGWELFAYSITATLSASMAISSSLRRASYLCMLRSYSS